MEHPYKDPTLMRIMAAALVGDVSDLCRRMASLNRRAAAKSRIDAKIKDLKTRG